MHRRQALTLGLGVTLGALGIPVLDAVRPAKAWAEGDDYPAKWRDFARDSVVDDWGYYNRNCTSWVAWALHARNGFEMPWAIGNAENWGNWAETHDYTVDANPAIGAVAWWDTSISDYGHVARVKSVDAAKDEVTIEEYNWGDTGNYNCRTIKKGNPTGYIHFADSADSGGSTSTSNYVIALKKRSFGSAQQVWTATKSGVYVDEWYPGSGGIFHTKVYTAKADEEVVDFDKINQPDGVTQSLYIATKSTLAGITGGVYEVWWAGNGYSAPAKLVTQSNITKVVANLQQSGSTLTHRLYVLAQDGPYEYWWRSGTGVSNGYRLWNINNGIAILKNVGVDGKDEVFVATNGNVYSMKWPVDGIVQKKVVNQLANTVGIAVRNLGTTELLYTATKTGVHETWWKTSTAPGWFSDPAKIITVPGSETVVGVQERLFDNTQNIFLATTDNVYRYLKGGSGFGNPALVVGVSPSQATAIDASLDPTDGNMRQVYVAHKSFVLERYWAGSAGTVMGSDPIVALAANE